MNDIALTRADHGRTLDIGVGSLLTLRLDESPTTGYVWVDQTAGDLLTTEGSDFVPGASGAVGGGGQRTLRLRVARPGSAVLRLVLKRSWEADAAAVDTFSVTLRATP